MTRRLIRASICGREPSQATRSSCVAGLHLEDPQRRAGVLFGMGELRLLERGAEQQLLGLVAAEPEWRSSAGAMTTRRNSTGSIPKMRHPRVKRTGRRPTPPPGSFGRKRLEDVRSVQCDRPRDGECLRAKAALKARRREPKEAGFRPRTDRSGARRSAASRRASGAPGRTRRTVSGARACAKPRPRAAPFPSGA